MNYSEILVGGGMTAGLAMAGWVLSTMIAMKSDIAVIKEHIAHLPCNKEDCPIEHTQLMHDQ